MLPFITSVSSGWQSIQRRSERQNLRPLQTGGVFFFFFFDYFGSFFFFFRTAFCLNSAYRLRTNYPLRQDAYIFIRFKFDYFHHVWSAVKASANQR